MSTGLRSRTLRRALRSSLALLLCALFPAQLLAQVNPRLRPGTASGHPAATEHPGPRSGPRERPPSNQQVAGLERTATGWFGLRAADPGLFAISAGLWVGSAAAGAVLLSRRGALRAQSAALVSASDPSAQARIELQRPALNADYNAKGTALVLGAGGINTLAVTSSLLGLPQAPDVPWWAWAAGGAGAALLVSGAVATLAVDRCEITAPEQDCGAWTRDSLFGPWLMIHAAAPLSVGLTYALSQLTSDPVSVSIAAEPSHAALSLRGSF